jgi:hypothetical protein
VLSTAAAAQGAERAQGWRAYTFYAIGLAAGILFRTLVPLLIEWQQNPDLHWERKYWLPPILGTLISIPAVFMGLANLHPPTGGIADVVAAFTLAYTAQDLTRTAQKAIAG